jgi:hypothetical protein
VLHRLFIIFLAVTVGAFSEPVVLALHATEKISEYDEEREVKKEGEEESSAKSKKENFNGPEFDSEDFFSALLGYSGSFSNQAQEKNGSRSSFSSLPLYLLHHSLKLDCRQ